MLSSVILFIDNVIHSQYLCHDAATNAQSTERSVNFANSQSSSSMAARTILAGDDGGDIEHSGNGHGPWMLDEVPSSIAVTAFMKD